MYVCMYIHVLRNYHFSKCFKIPIPGSHLRPIKCIRIMRTSRGNSDDHTRFKRPSLRITLLVYRVLVVCAYFHLLMPRFILILKVPKMFCSIVY